MSPDLVVHFERTAYRRFIAASLALWNHLNARTSDPRDQIADLRLLEARAAHEERRYRRWLRYRFAVMGGQRSRAVDPRQRISRPPEHAMRGKSPTESAKLG